MEQLKVITPKWLIGWAALSIQIILSQLFLTAPFIPLVWLLWNWIAVSKFGAPRLSFVEAIGATLLLKFLQTNAMMMQRDAEKKTDPTM